MYVCMPTRVTGVFYFFKDNMYMLQLHVQHVIKRGYFHSRPIAQYVYIYAFVQLMTGHVPSTWCTHDAISAPIVSNDLVTTRQPCNLLSQFSTCMDVEHSLCVQCVQTCTDTCCMLRQLCPCMGCHMDLTQAVVLCRCTYGVQLAGHMSKLCFPNCTYITITTVTILW